MEPAHEGLGTRRGAQMAENDAHFINRGHFGAGVEGFAGWSDWGVNWTGGVPLTHHLAPEARVALALAYRTQGAENPSSGTYTWASRRTWPG